MSPIVNFTVISQSIAEGSGKWSGWPVSLVNWTHRRELAIHGVAGPLTNYPVMIKLDATRISYGSVQALGQDLRFTDQTGAVIPHEIEFWDPLGTSIVWVKVATLAAYPSYTKIWMYYGNAVVADGQNVTAVWDADHLGVWHLGSANDATTNAGHGTITGPVAVPGKAGRSMSFAGGVDRIALPDNIIANKTVMTLEGWFQTAATDLVLFGWSALAYPAAPGSYVPSFQITSDAKFKAEQWMGASTPITTSANVNDGNWHYAVLVVNSPNQSLYVDGVLVGNLPGAITTFASTKTYLGFGYTTSWNPTAGGWRAFNGQLDEFRFSTVARSPDWIQANFLAINDVLVTHQPEETQNTDAALLTVQLNQPATGTVTIPFVVTGTATTLTDHDLVSGSVVITTGNSSGTFFLRPLRDYAIEASETVIVTLGSPTNAQLGTDTVHTVTITDEVLVAPDAIDDNQTLTSLSPQTLLVLSNDTDGNNDLLSITAISAPTWGTAVRSGKTIIYTPSGDFGATDSFTYTISDGRGGSDTATVTLTYQIPLTWLGSGADANWSTPQNWLGGVVPTGADTVYFNNQCTTYCNPDVDGPAAAAGWRMNTSYTGTINQIAGQTISIGSAGYLQRAGTFAGSSGAITIDGSFTLNAGTFTSTASVLAISDALTKSGGLFNHNNGEIKFEKFAALGTSTINITGTLATYDLRFAGGQAGGAASHTWNINTGNFTTANKLQIGRTAAASTSAIFVNGGTITLTGNLVIDPNVSGAGTTNIVFSGGGAQTYEAAAFGGVPNLIINKVGGSVTPASGTAHSFAAQSFTMTAGDFTAPSGTLTIHQAFIQTAGTFTPNGGTLLMDNVGRGTAGGSSAITVAAPLSLNNLSIAGGWTASANNYSWTVTGTLMVAGNYSQGRTTGTGTISLNGGAVEVLGNSAFTAGSGGGTTALTLNSAGAQSISQTAATIISGATFTVNKAGGTVTQTTAISYGTVGQNLNLNSGVYTMNGFALGVNNTLTVGASAHLICAGGTVTYGSAIVNGQVSCGPTIGITWTGNAGDNLWTTAGNWTNNTIPGASDIAIFGSSCAGLNCNATTTGAISVRGIILQSGYTGTLTQSAGHTIDVGSGGWVQAGGTFAGGNSQIQIASSYSLTGGTFTSTSGTLRLTTNWTSTAGTFNHNSGTVEFYGDLSQTISSGAAVFNSVNMTKITSNWRSVIITGTMTTGNLSLTSTGVGLLIDTGNIDVSGNLTVTGAGKAGSGAIRLVGAGAQTITASSSIPRLTINKPGGTATFTGTLQIYYDLTYLAGGVDFTGSIIEVIGDANTTLNMGAMPTMNEFRVSKANSNVRTITITGILKTIMARFSHTSYGTVIDGGAIEITGDVFFNSAQYVGGTSIIKIVGSGNQTITGIATSGIPSLEINSTGGIVTLAGTLSFIRNFTHLGGVVDAGTSLVNFGYNGWYNGLTFAVTPGSIQFNNVTFRGTQNVYTLTGTLIVNGALVLGDQSASLGYINTGTIQANGSVTTNSFGYAGSALLQISGTGNQTITGNATSPFFETEIISTGGTVTLAGTLSLSRGLKYSSGTVDAGASTVQIGYVNWYNNLAHNLDTNSLVLNNVTITGINRTFTLLSDINVNGNLTLGDTASSGSKILNGFKISVAGNVVFNNYGYNGTTALEMKGATLTTLTVGATAAKMTGTFTVNKTGAAEARMVAATNFNGASQDVTVTSGVLDLDGYDFFIQDTLTVAVGATVKCGGGALTYVGLANSGTINCAGFGGHQFDWTGAGGNTDWNTPGNWSGGVVPGPSDTPVFTDSICGATCNATINVDPNVRGVWITSPYTGTITQGAGVVMTIGRSGWLQPAGTFVGSNANITVGKSLLITGGSFTSTSAQLTILKNVTTEGAPNNDTVFDIAGSTFLPNGGTLRFNELNSTANSYTHRINIPSGLTVANTIFNSEGAGTGTTTWQINAAQTLSTTNSLTMGRVSGAANVAVSATTLEISGSANYTNGAAGGAVTQTNFNAAAPATINVAALATVPLGAYTINGNGGYTITGNLRSSGLLTVGNTSSGAVTMNGGTIEAQANVVISNFGYAGTTAFNFTGGLASTLTVGGSASVPTGPFTLNKTGTGSLALTSTLLLNSAGQNLNVTAGILNMAGFNLTVANATTIGHLGTLNCGGGTLTPGTLTAYGSIDCPVMQRRVFAYTGADQTFTVPAGVTSLTIKMWGAGGGGTLGSAGYGSGFASNGGGGGFATGVLAVTPASVLTMIVGRGGEIGNSGASAEMYGGGGRRSQYGGAGGGRSAIRTSVPVELMTAAGGGGGGSSTSAGNNNNTAGGAGGGTTGLAGASVAYPAITGKGGTPSAGGAAGVGSGGTAFPGTQYVGGRAAVAVNAGGGGGGGYYGGGGADFVSSTVVGGGGGGSSYISGAGVSGASTTAGSGTTQGAVADPENGGAGAGGAAGTAGANGKIIISW